MSEGLALTNVIQKRREDTLGLGMWIFLLSELMLFGGIIFTFLISRFLYGAAFQAGSARLHVALGSLNTAVLLTSSLTMALAVNWAKKKANQKWLELALLSTAALGLIFLCIKGYEYYLEFRDGLMPWKGFYWNQSGDASQVKLYFTFYFFMTALHAFHMCIGITAILGLVIGIHRKMKALPYLPVVGLYWHFVDIVWVFLFPLLYLNGRT